MGDMNTNTILRWQRHLHEHAFPSNGLPLAAGKLLRFRDAPLLGGALYRTEAVLCTVFAIITLEHGS